MIFDEIGSDLSKLDETGSNWLFHQSKIVIVKSCSIYHEDKDGNFILDQIGSNLSKMLLSKVVTFNRRINRVKVFCIRLVKKPQKFRFSKISVGVLRPYQL